MKSFISSSVYEPLLSSCDHQKKPPPLLRSITNNCVSITGQYLNSSGSVTVSLFFPDSEFLYEVEFVVCDNVLPPLDCLLGWDFLMFYSLQLTVLGDSYSLVGPHGSTPIIPWQPALRPPSYSCSINFSAAREEIFLVFEQSSSQGPIILTLVDNFSIPSCSECILEAKTLHDYSDQLGMAYPQENSGDFPYITAFTLNKAVSCRVFIRVMKPCDSSIQLLCHIVVSSIEMEKCS